VSATSGTAAGADLLVTGIGQLVDFGSGGPSDPPEVVEDAYVWIREGRVAARGPASEAPDEAAGAARLDAAGGVVLPGLVDSHTHAVFGGTREHEFERRLAGATYQEIAAAGGGILWSVRDLRARADDELLDLTAARLVESVRWGVTTVEVKSGYGLTVEDELRSLRIARRLDRGSGLPRVIPTFLGAHAVPPEFATDRAGYVRRVVDEMLPAVAEEGLARFCDVFCDEGAFTARETEAILTRARELGLGLKLHADEFSGLGGARLAARLGAVSADHLVAIDAAGIEALAAGPTVATLLPGTSFFLRLGRFAPARRLVDAGATVALATDFNPGSSMTQNLLLMAAFGCCLMGLRIDEALRAVTCGGARALAREDLGTLAPGAAGDLAVFAVPDYRHLVYHYGVGHVSAVVRNGRPIGPVPRPSSPAPVGWGSPETAH
jgi:imidazolonepropionase